MLDVISPFPYVVTTGVVAALGVGACLAARRHPGPTARSAARVFAVALVVDASAWWLVVVPRRGDWSVAGSLPLALCNMAIFVVAAACWWQTPLLVELTWFWGLAGALQALLTPDLTNPFPQPEFFQYTVGHLAVVIAACYLVLGLRITPRPGAVWRVFGLTVGYTAAVGLVDALSGANYMFLRSPPGSWTLLALLGPWPWYLLTASALALGLLALLNLPFWLARRADHAQEPRAPVPRTA